MKLAEAGQPHAQTSANNWARASAKRITPALPKHGGRLQVAMLAAQRHLEKKVQLVSCHPDCFSEEALRRETSKGFLILGTEVTIRKTRLQLARAMD